ncbi:hypothetical protein IHE44_0002958 [Lamprotornis superbus]|uniref:Uncharacterized protein n=1 Tax=Lamprotornis superbus TaxID=245042 RepID=A0A835TRG5_9PASS|nr:hypothetical protein IHE44_0002958 [Lamprotornis superbus]
MQHGQANRIPPGVALTPFLSTVSHSYGYGLLDAGAMVSLAKNWTTVGPQRKCVIDILAEPRYRLVRSGEDHSTSLQHRSLRASGPEQGVGRISGTELLLRPLEHPPARAWGELGQASPAIQL